MLKGFGLNHLSLPKKLAAQELVPVIWGCLPVRKGFGLKTPSWPLFLLGLRFSSRCESWNGHLNRGDDGGDECEMKPCQIGSIRPRRQALERRTLHPTRPTVPSGKQWFQSSNNWLSRFVNLHTRRWRGQMRKDDKPHWLHKSATPSPRATYTPDFQIHKPNSYFVIFFLQIFTSHVLP